MSASPPSIMDFKDVKEFMDELKGPAERPGQEVMSYSLKAHFFAI